MVESLGYELFGQQWTQWGLSSCPLDVFVAWIISDSGLMVYKAYFGLLQKGQFTCWKNPRLKSKKPLRPEAATTLPAHTKLSFPPSVWQFHRWDFKGHCLCQIFNFFEWFFCIHLNSTQLMGEQKRKKKKERARQRKKLKKKRQTNPSKW